MSTAETVMSPQDAVDSCKRFLLSFVPNAIDIMVEELNLENDSQWLIALGFNLPSPLDTLRTPFGRSSLERDHHRRFKFDVQSAKVVAMSPNHK